MLSDNVRPQAILTWAQFITVVKTPIDLTQFIVVQGTPCQVFLTSKSFPSWLTMLLKTVRASVTISARLSFLGFFTVQGQENHCQVDLAMEVIGPSFNQLALALLLFPPT